MPEQMEAELATELRAARRGLRAFLADAIDELKDKRGEIAVEALCLGIETAIPVPILGKVLSSSVRKALGGALAPPTASIDDVLAVLSAMQTSDEAFAEGLRELGADLDAVATDVRAVRQVLADQQASALRLLGARVDPRWPMLDNRISAVVANAGGGTLFVDEIYLEMEAWAPETRVDYSVPAAPLAELHLRADLETTRREYPLLALNGAAPRVYNERGAGSERVTIDLSSEENARYSLRLRLPYTDLDGAAGTLSYPPEGEEPIELAFVVAPGWRNVDPARLHERDRIGADVAATLAGVAAALDAYRAGADDQALDRELERLRVPRWVVGGFSFTAFVARFVPLLAALAPDAERERSLTTALALLPHLEPGALAMVVPDIAPALTVLAAGSIREPRVAALLAAEDDGQLSARLVEART